MGILKNLPFLLLAFLLLLPSGRARADAAPPMNPPGGDVGPEGGTQVQMTAEQVTIDFRQSTDDSAAVSAWFLFHNTGDADEHLKVRFPLNGDPRRDQVTGGEGYPLIDDLVARVGGQTLATATVEDDDPNAEQFFLGGSAVLFWAVFDMDFPAGKDVKLTITYTLHPTELANFADVYYLLSTGAGWMGPIGNADIVVLFPYVLNEYDLPYADDLTRWDAQFDRTTIVLENQIRIHYHDLEPTQDNNVAVGMVSPHLWQEVLRRRLQVIATPDEPQAWLALARAYAAAGQEKHGMFITEGYSQAYLQAFERALALKPKDASLHVEFASGLLRVYDPHGTFYSDTLHNELATAYRLDPKNSDLLALLGELQIDPSGLPTPGPFPTLAAPTLVPEPTETPATGSPTAAPTVTPQPTDTSMPPTPAPVAPTGSGNLPAGWLVGFAVLVLAGAVILNWRSTQKRD